MKRPLMRLALAASFLLMVGVAPSAANTVTFDNSSAHRGGTFTIGQTVGIAGGIIDAVAGGSASANTNQLQIITPTATTAVPEPGSLMLLGSGLFLFARVVRTRVK